MHPALGIDYGDARIGIAATDSEGILPYPVETIQATKGDPVDRIAHLVEKMGIKVLILGLPIRSDGTEGTAAEKVRAFGALLSKRISHIPLTYVDEYMTTIAAAEKLHQAGKNSKKQRKMIDQAAAVEILQTWLDNDSFPHIS